MDIKRMLELALVGAYENYRQVIENVQVIPAEYYNKSVDEYRLLLKLQEVMEAWY